MKFDISALIGGAEARLPFSCRLDPAGLTDDVVSGAAEFSGVFENHSGYLSLTAKAALSLEVRCARCGKVFPAARPTRWIVRCASKARERTTERVCSSRRTGRSICTRPGRVVSAAVPAVALALPRGLPRDLPGLRAGFERGDMHLRRQADRSAAGKAGELLNEEERT